MLRVLPPLLLRCLLGWLPAAEQITLRISSKHVVDCAGMDGTALANRALLDFTIASLRARARFPHIGRGSLARVILRVFVAQCEQARVVMRCGRSILSVYQNVGYLGRFGVVRLRDVLRQVRSLHEDFRRVLDRSVPGTSPEWYSNTAEALARAEGEFDAAQQAWSRIS